MPPPCMEVNVNPGPPEVIVHDEQMTALLESPVYTTWPMCTAGPTVATITHASNVRPRFTEVADELSKNCEPEKVEEAALMSKK